MKRNFLENVGPINGYVSISVQFCAETLHLNLLEKMEKNKNTIKD
jgi:hypothetical protein